MGRVLFALVVLSAGFAVSAGARSAAADGGLFGIATVGPITPVCVAEQPCTKPLAGAVLVFSRGSAGVARVTTRRDGSYRIRLAPGVYTVRSAIRRLEPTSVRVRAASTRRVDFSIDTGIR